MRKLNQIVGIMVVAGLAPQVLAQDKGNAQNIVQTAIAAGQFKTLVKAVEAAGLVETLSGTGPFRHKWLEVQIPVQRRGAEILEPLDGDSQLSPS